METSVRPGDVLLGKYRVERVLGQGGMGVVVAARHIDLGELYAIKFLLPEALANHDALDRFLREARASARLKGEHVAKVHDVGRLETGAPYMVMEHLEGNDLKHVLRARGPLPAEEAAALLLQACDAIAEAHATGIIHRDLKPANLFLIRRPNGTPCLKVLDFGISKQKTPEDVDLTKSGTIMGSPLYMSPEQMKRTKSADARSDIWSLGVVLYELVTGRGPFVAETMMEVLALVLQEDPEPPSRVREGVPAELDAIVLRCLQKRVEDRFQSIAELAAALQPIAWTRASSASLLPAIGRALPLDPAFQPASTTLRVAPANAAAARASQSDAATPRPSQPSVTPAGMSVTDSSWGRTGGGARTSLGAGKVPLVVAVVLAGISLGLAGVWLLLRPSSPTASATQPVETASHLAESAAAPVGLVSPTAPLEPTVVPAEPPTTAATPAAVSSGDPLAAAASSSAASAASPSSPSSPSSTSKAKADPSSASPSSKPQSSAQATGPAASPTTTVKATRKAPQPTTTTPPKKDRPID